MNLKSVVALALMLAVIMPNGLSYGAGHLACLGDSQCAPIFGDGAAPDFLEMNVNLTNGILLQIDTGHGNGSRLCYIQQYNNSNDPNVYVRIENYENSENVTPWHAFNLDTGDCGWTPTLKFYFRSDFPEDLKCGTYKLMSNFTVPVVDLFYENPKNPQGGQTFISYEAEYQIDSTPDNDCLAIPAEDNYVPQYEAGDIAGGAIDATAGLLVGFAPISQDIGMLVAIGLIIVLVGGLIYGIFEWFRTGNKILGR